MKHQDVCGILTRCMASVFILHGLGGSPTENWFPWLQSELETTGHTVHVPVFPNADRPMLEEWIQEFERYEDRMNEGTVLVGHSLGGTFAMRYLERAHVPVQATFLVAPVVGIMGNPLDEVMPTFNTEPFDWTAIARNGGDIHILHSDNDPYIPLQQAENAALNLMVAMDLVHGGEHLNTRELPELRDVILASVI